LTDFRLQAASKIVQIYPRYIKFGRHWTSIGSVLPLRRKGGVALRKRWFSTFGFWERKAAEQGFETLVPRFR
jgi:hypothetical protein